MDEDKIKRLKECILKAVPDMAEENAKAGALHLFENDFCTPDDLQYVQFEDLRAVYSVGHSRRLCAHWQPNCAGPSTTTNPVGGTPGGSSAGRRALQEKARTINSQPLPNYDEDSPYMPSSVRKAIKEMKLAPTKGREDMVQRIVDHCRESVPGFQRNMLRTVARNLVQSYPATFKDTLPVSEHGSEGLAYQMVNKYDNDARCKVKTDKENQAPASKESFGCILWNPPMPEQETTETQEEKREELVAMHQLTKKLWKWNVIKVKMEETFYLQRLDLNGPKTAPVSARRKRRRDEDDPPQEIPKGKTVLEMKDRWPFLFTPRGINTHFQILTGQNFKFLNEKFSSEIMTIIEFLACKGEAMAKLKRKTDRAERGGNPEAVYIGLISMLIQHFKEDKDLFVTFVDPTTTYEEAPAIAKLPQGGTPVLVAAGTSVFSVEKYFMFIDNQLVASAKIFTDALTLIFCAYFTFQIDYPSGLACVLIFIQRVIAKIHAEGTKGKDLKKSAEKVTKFHNKLEEYKQKLEQEELDED